MQFPRLGAGGVARQQGGAMRERVVTPAAPGAGVAVL